jgi:hypothetical protein
LGQQVVRQHRPSAATPVQVEKRMQHVSHINLAWATSVLALLGGRDQRGHDGSWLVRQIRGRPLPIPKLVIFQHVGALLCTWAMRQLSNKAACMARTVAG